MKIYEIKVFIVMLSAIFTLALVWIMSFDMCEITNFCQDDKLTENKITIYIQKNNGETIPIKVEVADSSKEIEKGLMYREELSYESGMIFIMPYERDWHFWMKNTKIPLDMIFVDKNLDIIHVKERAEPCLTENCESYNSNNSVNYIIEVNAGWTFDKGVKAGDKVMFNI